MASRLLTIGKETKSYLDWYRQVLGEELDEIGPGLLTKRFDDVGISLLGRYRYTLSFIKLGKGPPELIIKAGIYAFGAAIKKDEINYTKAADGSPMFVNGVPKYTVVRNVFDSEAKGQRHAGFFADVGIGLGFSFSLAGGGILGDAEFLSDQDLNFEDFANAHFSVACARGPTASMGNFVSFDSFTTKFVEITLPSNNVVLTSSKTDSFKLNPPKVPGIDDLSDPKKYVSKWLEAKLDGKIFDLSMGFGYFVYMSGQGQLDKPPLPDPMKPTIPSNYLKRSIQAFFQVDSADLSAGLPDGTTPRYSLEILLAIERAMFDTVDARARAWGYASPEYTATYNLGLSQARADAVVQAVRDAYGPTLSIKDLQSQGLGEAPAETAGLHDPESLQLTVAQFTVQYPDEVAEWPQWRRVDLDVEGTLIASAGTAEP